MAGYRPPYTLNEQNTILEFIVERKAYYELRGRAFWQELEESGRVNRTWQSLKEHFRMKIEPVILSNSRFSIGTEERMKIRTGWDTTVSHKIDKPKSSKQINRVDLESMDSSDEDKFIHSSSSSKGKKERNNSNLKQKIKGNTCKLTKESRDKRVNLQETPTSSDSE